MPATALRILPSPAAVAERPERDRIGDFVAGASFEADAVLAEDIETLRRSALPRTRVDLAATPERAPHWMVATAAWLRRAGFEPVPHLEMPAFATAAPLADFLKQLKSVGVSRVVLGEDVEGAGGSVTRARKLIESGLLQRHGIVEVGVTACLGDHPRVPDATLDRSLVATIEAATQTGLAVHVVTPLVFDAQAMVRWLMRLRDLGFGQPVRIGLAGPANLGALVDYAGRRHVPINPSSLAGRCGHAKHLVGLHTPAAAIRTLATAAMRGELGPVAPHIHAVRGLAAAVRWTAAATRGPIRLDPACGFAVEAP